tara:strand:+ start:151 stop:420 length:270 start_codon:yes stop_codon:yes gene_type:complete
MEIEDCPDRCLFWARFHVNGNEKKKFFVSTVHMPWPGCDAEIESGCNQRIPCAIKVVESLRRVVPPGEPVIVAGDFNEDYHPQVSIEEV